jgi:hypothetical protein
MEKREVWELAKNRNIDIPNKDELYRLLEANMHRIEFVNDHIGLKDFAFIAEVGSQFTDNLFIALDVKLSTHGHAEENEQGFFNAYDGDPIECLKKLRRFFSETERTLALGVGFIECLTTMEDHFKAMIGVTQGEFKTMQEGLKKLRRFPVFYDRHAKTPEQFNEVENEKLKNKIEDTMQQINDILDKKTQQEQDKIEFERLSKYYKRLKA